MTTLNVAPSLRTRACLLDVDLPFLKILPEHSISEGSHFVDLRIGQQAYPVQVSHVRSCEAGQFWVRLSERGTSGELLEHRFLKERLKLKADERRIAQRHKTILTVQSCEEPYFRGTTYDISQTGLRLVTDRLVPSGTILTLEVKDHQEPPVRIQGEVIWSSVNFNSLYHTGLRLI